MLNEIDYFWKNWRLGTELQISGSFVFNGILVLDKMETFHFEEECFEFLYNLSIGFERLFKIAIILLEHDAISNQEEFEKSLITHDHLFLLNRIQNHKKLKIGKAHKKFISLLSIFYKTARYERFNIKSVYKPNRDRQDLVKFIQEDLKIQISIELMGSTEITSQIRKFLGKVIGTFTEQLYEIVKSECYRIGTFTYELSYKSKAFKIFIAKEYDFEKEKLAQKEVMLFLLKTKPNKKFNDFLKHIEPLNFEAYHTYYYISSIFNFNFDRMIFDELDSLNEEQKSNKNRKDLMSVFGTDYNIE